MGVRELATFIKHYVPDGYRDVSIVEECKKFKRIHGRKPEIVIDIHGFSDLIVNFDPDNNVANENLSKLEILCGGRPQKYQRTCEILFEKLASVADLVFFEDGTVRPGKTSSLMTDKNNENQKMIDLIDKAKEGIKLTEYKECYPRILISMRYITKIVKKYGKYKISITRECDAEIVKYANENKSFAVLAEDSDFLIFEGDWRYFSANDLKIATLSTKEFNKPALWRTLGLTNSYQMSLLATLNGNDFTSFDDLYNFHSWLTDGKNKPERRFLAIAKYIKEKLNQNPNSAIEKIVRQYKTDLRDNARVKVTRSIEMYRTDFSLRIITSEIERFCIENSYQFICSIITKCFKQFKIRCMGLRNEEDFLNMYEVEKEIYEKQAGIVLKHKNEGDIELEVIAKQTHDKPFEMIKVKPDYPPFDLPPLIELLSPEKFKHHDKIRWLLLRWMTDMSEEILNVKSEFLQEILTLKLMQRRGFIEVFEADLILLNMKMVQEGNYDTVYDKVPEFLNKRAFQLQFLIAKFHEIISKCFKVCGLEKRYEGLYFDGVIFHNLYLKYSKSSEIPAIIPLLGDLVPYRLYA